MPLPITRQIRLFCLLVCHGNPSYYDVGVFSLPIFHGMHLVAPAQLCPFGWYVILARHFPQKSPGRNLKIGSPLSPPPNHAFLPLTHDLLHPVLAGYRLVRSGPCACLSSICVQNLPTTHSSTMVWRLACTVCRPFLTFYVSCFLISRFPLGAGPFLLLGFTFLSVHFLIALISCHIILSFLL